MEGDGSRRVFPIVPSLSSSGEKVSDLFGDGHSMSLDGVFTLGQGEGSTLYDLMSLTLGGSGGLEEV